MTQQFKTAKYQAACLNRVKLHQSNLQLQNQAALMSRRVQALGRRRYAVGLACTHSGLQDRILLYCTRIENVHKVRKKTFVLCYVYRSPENFYSSFPFSRLRHYQMPECFYVNNCCF